MALNQVSPGITVTEIDLTTSVPAFGVNTRGAISGAFKWGPALSATPVTSEVELVSKFGAPDTDTANVFFTAASFLAYSTDLYVSRANATGMLNATANADVGTTTSGLYIPNETYYTSNTVYLSNGATEAPNVAFIARYAGAKGNSLEISLCPSADAFTTWVHKGIFDSAPGTSTYAEGKNSANDEMHIAVVDRGGLFSGIPGTVLERFGYVSKASDARTDDGTINYYKEVLLNKSKYILWVNHPTETTTTHWGNTAVSTAGAFGSGSQNVTVRFINGADGSVQAANRIAGYNVFADKENIDIDLLIGADSTQTAGVSNAVLEIATTRKDCVAFVSPTFGETFGNDPATAIKNRIEGYDTYRSSYGVMDSGWKYMYDKYNDRYRWVPLNGDVAGLCARTDRDRDPWYSPAGFSRGGIKNVIKLGFNPKKAERDTLYKAGVNPIISLPGEGVVLFGDKTMLGKPSSFDRINVRRLFITLEKAVERAARASLFEFNDEFTRSQFVSLVEPFLRTVQGRRGIYDFRVVCDETNNPPEVVDSNEFVGDIYIKPARSINFIQLNFVAVKTGVDFKEVVGKF